MAARAQEPLPETLGVVISGMTIDKFDRDKLARRTATEFSKYERKIATRLGNFAVTPTTFKKDNMGNYSLQRTSLVAQFLYWGAAVNTLIKFGFLCVLISGYLGSIPFLDKIAALDYFLCVGIATFGGFIWGSRYPIHEIIHSLWKLKNSIYSKLGFPSNMRQKVDRIHKVTVWMHLAIVWIGCSCLAYQFFEDPKYCGFTYSAFTWDPLLLRVLFCAHEFFFMMNPWNLNSSSSSLATFQGASLSALLHGMTQTVKQILEINVKEENTSYSIGELIFDYKQMSLLTDRFNEWVAYKILAIHICCYCQLISDVFVAMQVLRAGGGIMDVWFYLEDCLTGILMIYRVYTYMSRVSVESDNFLKAITKNLEKYSSRKRKLSKMTRRSLKVVSLRLGPIDVSPSTVLTAMDTFGNYYVCVAVW